MRNLNISNESKKNILKDIIRYLEYHIENDEEDLEKLTHILGEDNLDDPDKHQYHFYEAFLILEKLF